MKSILITSSSLNFYKNLENLYIKTSEASLEDEENGQEGSIIYFVVQDMGNQRKCLSRTVGAAKLKTLEYRFFRKIREKILRFINKK